MTQRFSQAVLQETPTSCRLLPPCPPPLATHARPRPGALPLGGRSRSRSRRRSQIGRPRSICRLYPVCRTLQPDPATPPSTRHGAGSPPPPPHPPARHRGDAEPQPQQGKPQARLAAPRPLSVGVRPLPRVPSTGSRPSACSPDGARRCAARGLQGALRASALVAWRGPPIPACAQECDGRVVLVPPHLGNLFWDKRRCNLFTVLFGVSSPKQESQAKKK